MSSFHTVVIMRVFLPNEAMSVILNCVILKRVKPVIKGKHCGQVKRFTCLKTGELIFLIAFNMFNFLKTYKSYGLLWED